ncbi:MAG: hypothetical protein CVU57_23470 [Deltaproteobacteria bacterium HGW-Deltaproteobacteria-15]|jgi:hypothetical protein|nr:MAG: hypothetical protein CVU57_23470 [Deltaproteobacteria bacterium HGW-Deltaproteobacteria-15]
MRTRIFREGGPYGVKKTGPDQYTMSISIPSDEDGRTARECPNDDCSPGYFKVKGGTGIKGQEIAFCPYCRHEAEPGDFTTKEQVRYAKDLVLQEAHEGIEGMLKDALGLGPSRKKTIGGGLLSIEMSLKPGQKPVIHRPFEEKIRRDVVCPRCGLDHSVYGLATWCADCGEDIFLTHVESELSVIRTMLGDVERRMETLGVRVAAKDMENCLEDTVSIFEAVLKTLVRRYKRKNGTPVEEIDRLFKKIGNSFQNIVRSVDVFENDVGMKLFDSLSEETVDALARVFEKRHPITHNLGIVDKKYIEKARSSEREGREVLISIREVHQAIDLSLAIFSSLHKRMFSVIRS